MKDVVIQDRIEVLPIESLVPYARNSRTHDEDQVDQLAASIREFGFTNPVLIDDAGELIAGHGRVMAAKSLGLARVPCIRLGHLTEQQKRAYVIADNKLALNAGWDEDMLRQEMEALRDASFDLSLIGFDADELAQMFEPPEDERDADSAPGLSEEVHSKLGDVWILGPHRVGCGDSSSADLWDRILGGELLDAVWTDPPYNVAYESKLAGKIKNDDMDAAEFLEFLRKAYAAMFSVMKPGAAIYVAHADTEGLAFRRAFSESGFKLSSCIIWRKDSLVLGRSDYQWIHEPILYGWKPGSRHRWYGGRKQVTVQDAGDDSPFEQLEDGRWSIRVGDQVLIVDGAATVDAAPSSFIVHEKPRRSAEHPTMKPVSLIERMLKHSARSGDLIGDFFGGSGSTLMAAERMGMCGRLAELDPKFVDVIVKRWQNYTGRRALHAVSGHVFPVDPQVGEAS